MSNPPKVSVILPFFNAERTLNAAIQSILDQTFDDFELLLVDNNSSDDSQEIARSNLIDSRVHLLTELNQGVVHAANKGLIEAHGEYVVRMDADDVSRPERLELQVTELVNDQSIGWVAGLVTYVGSEQNEGLVNYVKWSNSIQSSEEISLNQFVEYPLVNPTIMMRQSCIKNVGLYQEGNFPEDYEYFLRTIAADVRMKKINQVVLDWNDLPNRLTRSDDRYSQDSFFKLKSIYIARWLARHNPFHPKVSVWGGGKLAKKYSNYLHAHGIIISNEIDVDEKNASATYYKDVDTYRETFILSYVTSRGARDHIRTFLNENGFIEGKNYLICG